MCDLAIMCDLVIMLMVTVTVSEFACICILIVGSNNMVMVCDHRTTYFVYFASCGNTRVYCICIVGQKIGFQWKHFLFRLKGEVSGFAGPS